MGEHAAVSAVIPARNEASTVAQVVSAFVNEPRVAEVVVVDNDSTDETATQARRAGARIVECSPAGYGRAVKAGVAAATRRWIFKCDADMRNATSAWLDRTLDALHDDTCIVKTNWTSPDDIKPVTHLLARPVLRRMFPQLLFIETPLSGVYLFDRMCIDVRRLSDTYGFDLEMILEAWQNGLRIDQVHIGEMLHATRPIAHDSQIAYEILCTMLTRYQIDPRQRMLVLMAHSDDPVIWCGGALAKYLQAGASVRVVLVTGIDERPKEFATLANYYPNVEFTCLHADEFTDFTAAPVHDSVTGAIADFRPDILITHHRYDPHPDHRMCFAACCSALMSLGRAHFPAKFLMSAPYFFETVDSGGFRPSVFLDISEQADLKYRMLKRHRSQDVAYWSRMARLMDSLNGLRAGVAKAEAFEPMPYYAVPRAVARL